MYSILLIQSIVFYKVKYFTILKALNLINQLAYLQKKESFSKLTKLF